MISTLVLVALLSSQTNIQAEEDRPTSNGLGLTIAGGIVTGIGALNMALSPLYRADFYIDKNGRTTADIAFYGSLIGGGVLLAVGVPMLIVGLVRRANYNAWFETHQVFFRVDSEGGALAWQMRF